MGEKYFYQPLTKKDKATVVLYRAGIAASTLIVCVLAYLAVARKASPGALNALLGLLHVSAGLGVFFIHLYASGFHRALKRLYYVSVAALGVLYLLGGGDISRAVVDGRPLGPLLLLPLSGCLGFIAAKEAFCFRLMEGYVLAAVMPFYLVLFAAGVLTPKAASYGMVFVAFLWAFFTLRKAFMPLHYDIGDKSAYR